MNTQNPMRGFSLIDCCLAMLIGAVAVTGAMRLCLASERAYARIQEQRVAWQILHGFFVGPVQTEVDVTLYYSWDGRPGDSSDKYQLHIQLEDVRDAVVERAELEYDDVDGESQVWTVDRVHAGLAGGEP